MHLRNGEHGYGEVTKALHWLTVLAISAQFTVGYLMEPDDAAIDREDDRLDRLKDGCQAETDSGEAAEEACEQRVEGQEDDLDAREDDYLGDAFSDIFSGNAFGDGLSLPETHVLLGLLILTLGVVRLVWRTTTPLPPWSENLSAGERILESWLEKVLLALLFLVPGSGLLLVADVGSLALHIATHIAFFATVTLHIGLVLRHTITRREKHLSRML